MSLTHLCFVLVASLALTLQSAGVAAHATTGSVYCTTATCLPGPVLASFEYMNCTGRVVYQQVIYTFGTCLNSTGTSQLNVLTSDYYEQRTYINNDNCGQNQAEYSYSALRTYFGTCRPNEARRKTMDGLLVSEDPPSFPVSAIMMLSNVNSSFEAPQNPMPADESIPVASDVEVDIMCESPTNCTFNGQEPFLIGTTYTNDTCSEPLQSGLFANVTSGQCLRESHGSTNYRSYSCLDIHTLMSEHYMNNACHRPAYASIAHNSCAAGYTLSYYCLAPPPTTTPTSPVVPTSSASFKMLGYNLLGLMSLTTLILIL